MKKLGIRDIIGPIMVGPSSSHTAGALRIAGMARRLAEGVPQAVHFTLYGSFAHTSHGHGTDRALVAGMLGMEPDDLRIRNSFDIAKDEGLTFSFEARPDEPVEHPNTVAIALTCTNGSTLSVVGRSIGGGAAVITRIDNVDVDLTGEYHSLVIRQTDTPGVLAHIANCLSACHINIATARMYREDKGRIAYTIMDADDVIPDTIIPALKCNPDIHAVRIIPADRPTGSTAQRPDGGASAASEKIGGAAATAPLEDLDFASGQQLLDLCSRRGESISEAMVERERALAAEDGAPSDVESYLSRARETMRISAQEPIADPRPSMGGLIGGEAQKLSSLEQSGICSPLLARAVTYSMAVLETNASMGRIVAAPTAGSSGVIPAALLAYQDIRGASDKDVEAALANAAAVGMLITRNATVAGAEGGCQAEVGAASAMAASALVQIAGGSPEQCLDAAATAISGLLGLVCDPIGGLVEAPCQKRNATGVANALVAAQIALAGIGADVPFDDAVQAMYAVGTSLPFELRESALGGLAATPSACAWCDAHQ
jgi:L-serine dehydratase